MFIAPEEEELEEVEDNSLASCLPDTFTIRKSSQVPVTSTASHTAETSIPESQSVWSEPASVLSEKRAINMSRSGLSVADILLPSLLQLESRVKARPEVTQGHQPLSQGGQVRPESRRKRARSLHANVVRDHQLPRAGDIVGVSVLMSRSQRRDVV